MRQCSAPKPSFAAQPGSGVNPLPIGAAGRDLQDRGGLIARKACEVAEFDELGLLRVDFGEPAQGRIECRESIVRLRLGRDFGIHAVYVASMPTAAVFGTRVCAVRCRRRCAASRRRRP